jgi:PhnB protein
MMMTHGQGPNANNGPANWKDAILHARITLGETELMGADIPNAQPMRSEVDPIVWTKFRPFLDGVAG